MTVRDLQNILSRFPGGASVSFDTIVAAGKTITVDTTVTRGTKGVDGVNTPRHRPHPGAAYDPANRATDRDTDLPADPGGGAL